MHWFRKLFKKQKPKTSVLFNYGTNNRFILIDENGIVKEAPFIKGLEVEFHGSNNIIKIHGNDPKFNNSAIRVGNKSIVEIQSTNHMLCFNVVSPIKESKLIIGKNFACCGADIYMHDERNNSIEIGDNCLLSFDIVLWPSDGHTIFDKVSKKILNPGGKIIIGDHVWIGMGVNIMKNTYIPNDCVVGARSLVNKEFEKQNCIIAGIPAKIIKENINWDISGIDDFKERTKWQNI